MKKELILFKILDDVKNILEKYSMVFWLDCGTLLGAAREGKLIKWDDDIDIGCWKEKDDHRKKILLKKDLVLLGYNVYLTDYWINIHNPDFPQYNFDINFYSVKGNKAITPSTSLMPDLQNPLAMIINHLIRFIYNNKLYLKKNHYIVKYMTIIIFTLIRTLFIISPSFFKNCFLDILIYFRYKLTNHRSEIVDKHFFTDLIQFDVFNKTYPIPREYKNYLAYRYGSNWETPIEKWDTNKQDNTVKHLSSI